jgi:hypothetical protein
MFGSSPVLLHDAATVWMAHIIVGTHKDRSYTKKEENVATPIMMKSTEIVPTIVGKDTMSVFLCTTVGCAGGRRAADLCGSVEARS